MLINKGECINTCFCAKEFLSFLLESCEKRLDRFYCHIMTHLGHKVFLYSQEVFQYLPKFTSIIQGNIGKR